MRRLAVVLLLTTGCFSPQIDPGSFTCAASEPRCPPGLVCDDGLCVAPGGNGPDGATIVDAAPPPDVPSCEMNGFVSCKNADVAYVCNATGNGLVEVACPVGCDGTLRRCLLLSPSNAPTACEPPPSAPPSRTLSGETLVDTDSCVTSGGVVLSQGASAPELCLFRYTDFVLPLGATLTARGKRALVIVALRKMILGGTLDASARLVVGGPGADPDRVQGRGQSAGSDRSEGGGGGGHATSGGSGGAAEGSDTTHPGGTAIGAPTLEPLTAGGFGGAGGYPCPTGGPPCVLRQSGGAGGGAVQLVACSDLELRASVVINAGGGGGNGGAGKALNELVPGGGDGGGAGGGVLIEAPQIDVPIGATLVANGGGGGGGGGIGDLIDASGKPGADGPVAERPATGGMGGNDTSGDGGRGGASNSPDPGNKGLSGGGGGGAAGRIRLNARPDRPPNVAGAAIISPEPTTGAIGRK